MGWETAAFVEWEPFCQKVLAKNFPNVSIYGDIKTFNYEQEKDRIGAVDLVCGGFPCQPFSTAGKRAGTRDDRYLWPEMLRVIREVRPSWVVGENVAGLLSMDGGAVFEEVCASLENEGYAVESFVIPAIAVGAPHRRDRVWIVAHFDISSNRADGRSGREEARVPQFDRPEQLRAGEPSGAAGVASDKDFRHADQPRLEGRGQHGERAGERASWAADWQQQWPEVATRFCRMDDGIPPELDFAGNRDNRTARLKALGNAIVPQVAYEIFRAIGQVEKNNSLPA